MAEFVIGHQPQRSDNIDNWPDVTWSQLEDYVPFLQGIHGTGPIDLLVLGKMYRSSDKIAGITRHVGDVSELLKVRQSGEDVTNPDDTLKIVERYFKLDELPSKIVAFVIKTPD